MSASRPDVVIVGAGLAGLGCALRLHQAGRGVLVLEASDGVGGRVRTDVVDGFRLDRGFQVLLTAYPETRRVLDYSALRLRPFRPGALVRSGGRFHELSDPWRQPSRALNTLLSGVGTLGDKLRMARLRADTQRGTLDELMQRPETSAQGRLLEHGFSYAMIDGFFRPFFGGILLDRSLSSSSRMMEFVFRMMAEGEVAVPARGMGEIPGQIAAHLPADAVRLAAPVAEVAPGRVRLASGETIECRAVVVASEGPEAARLTGRVPRPASRAVSCVYWAAERAPIAEPVLLLDGEGRGPVNNLAVLSNVAPEYAPSGAALVAASVLEGPGSDAELAEAVREQLREWFGAEVTGWRHLRTYRIPHAQPAQPPGSLDPPQRPVVLEPGLLVCGDHRDTASLHGALLSGRRAAEALLSAA